MRRVLVDRQGFRARARERTATAQARVQRVNAAQRDDAVLRERRTAALDRLRGAVRTHLARTTGRQR